MNIQHKLFVMAVAVASVLSVAGCQKAQKTSTPTAAATVGMEIDDTVITTKVKSALLADPDIKSFDLKVDTHKGEVQLSGFVDNQTQIDRAITVARGVEGVKSVDNKVSLKGGGATIGSKVDDSIITTKIKSALLADPDIKSLDIAVVTREGDVQLSGFVANQAQIDRATEIARGVEGVHNVINEMSVKK